MKKLLLLFILLILLPLSGFAQTKYVLPCKVEVLRQTAKVIHSQIGIVERTGRNDGEVEKYNRYMGQSKHAPYCCSGIYFCFAEAVKGLCLPNYFIPIPKTSVASEVFIFAKRNGIKTNYAATQGDLIIWRRHNSYKGHIEYVDSVGRAGFVRTVGFNSTKTIQNKKYEGVFFQKRNIMHPLGRLKIRGLVGFSRLEEKK